MTPVPRIVLEGDARARGLRHGSERRQAILDTLAIYEPVFALPAAELQAQGEHFAVATRAFAPDLADEMDAIADAAGVARYRIHALNARSEVVAGQTVTVPECTAAYLPATSLLGQTWDWLEALEPLIAVLDIRHADGHRLLTLSEPGMVGKIGLSSAGIGVCLNFLRAPGPFRGAPIHVLLRSLLELRDPAAIDGLLLRAGSDRAGHVLIGDAVGHGLSVEFTGGEARCRRSDDAPLLHTNHYLCAEIDAGPGAPNSRARLARAEALTASGGDWQTLIGLLSDCADSEHPVTVSWRSMPGWAFGPMGTVCAVAMDLRGGQLAIRRGPEPATAWESMRLHPERPLLSTIDSFGTA